MFVEIGVICCRFARILAHYSCVVLLVVAVFAGSCLIVPLIFMKTPDFSDPQMVSIPWSSSHLQTQYPELSSGIFLEIIPNSNIQHCDNALKLKICIQIMLYMLHLSV